MMSWTMLAHQGGWDEILYFAVPAALAIYGLRWAERRARRRVHDDAAGMADPVRRLMGEIQDAAARLRTAPASC